MKSHGRLAKLAGLALSAALTLGASGAAQAQDADIFWSINMSSPGVRVGISNEQVLGLPPVHVHPYPVYVPPPRVVYTPIYRSYPYYRGYGHDHGHHYGHDKHRKHESRHWGHDRDERHARGDHYRGRGDDHRGRGGDERGHGDGGRGSHSGAQMHMGRGR